MTIVAVYVDDILLTGSSIEEIHALKSSLHTAFGIKDLGQLHYFLGFEVCHMPDGVSLTQRKFTQDLLKSSGHLNTKSTATPLPLNCKRVSDDGVPLQDPTIYDLYRQAKFFIQHTTRYCFCCTDPKPIYATSHLISYGRFRPSATIHIWELRPRHFTSRC